MIPPPTKSIRCDERIRLEHLLSKAIGKVSSVDRTTSDYLQKLTAARSEQRAAQRNLREHVREHGCKVRVID